jgi:hypothetical protein
MNDYLLKALDKIVRLYFKNIPLNVAINQAKKELKDKEKKRFKEAIIQGCKANENKISLSSSNK